MSWLFLGLAIVLEVCGTTCMKLSQGFSKVIPSVLIFVFYGLSFTAFTFALKRIDLSFAYAIWAGLGVMLIGTIGINPRYRNRVDKPGRGGACAKRSSKVLTLQLCKELSLLICRIEARKVLIEGLRSA